ncbi:hypothetical protein OUZ56_026812 [Daphnia magna]|uniref:Uncharacterized protein n=1 Tax=Daphnia magna TaxID=35525 RepID=A0ABQ9ZN25_9CRUS|nr:hypothetical protein OUZ56_026812 [Daphnia magna]
MASGILQNRSVNLNTSRLRFGKIKGTHRYRIAYGAIGKTEEVRRILGQNGPAATFESTPAVVDSFTPQKL